MSEPVSERIKPDEVLSESCYLDHVARYRMAAGRVAGKKVLDAGCGAGYGSDILAETAAEVWGIDLAREDGIDYARGHYQRPNLHYELMDACRTDFADRSFDAVVSLEVIEHVPDWECYLSEVIRVLKDDGELVISTPNKAVSSPPGQPPYPYHSHEFDLGEFRKMLEERFREVEILGERAGGRVRRMHALTAFLVRLDFLRLRRFLSRKAKQSAVSGLGRAVGTGSLDDLSVGDIEFAREDLAGATNFIGLCRWPVRGPDTG